MTDNVHQHMCLICAKWNRVDAYTCRGCGYMPFHTDDCSDFEVDVTLPTLNIKSTFSSCTHRPFQKGEVGWIIPHSRNYRDVTNIVEIFVVPDVVSTVSALFSELSSFFLIVVS